MCGSPAQACAVHTLQALVRGSGLAAAVLHFAPSIAVVSLQLLSSPCWAMRNAALQLFSESCSLCYQGHKPPEENQWPADLLGKLFSCF